MIKTIYIRSFTAKLAALGFLLQTNAAEVTPKPNIVFILADDQRADELGCTGDPIVQTPTIDRLADEGVRFSNMFVNTPICMSSRATIFTGLTQRTHNWLPNKLTPEMLDSAFPVQLRKAGYQTAYFGKNHVKFEAGTDEAFDAMFNDWKHIHRRPYFKKMPDGTRRHCAELIGDRSAEFLKKQTADQPFFLYMSFNISHAEDQDHRPGIGQFPWPKSTDGMYEDVTPPQPHLNDPEIFNALPGFLQNSINRERWFWRWDTPEKYAINMRARYRMITGMDRVIGRVLETLRQKGLAENTIIIYSADNGLARGDRGLAGKWNHFEESLRVPLIIKDPRQPEHRRGLAVEPLVQNLDLPGTILSLAGVDIPATYQGRDLTPFIEGILPDNWRTFVFCEHPDVIKGIPGWSGIRGERYVYACYDHQDTPYEFLHDLQRDPDELENLVENPEYAEILQAMQAQRRNQIERYTDARETLPAAAEIKKSGIPQYTGGEVRFDGKTALKFKETPALGLNDSYAWCFQTRIEPGNPPGAILMGNRVTPGHSVLSFVKITADRGAQLFGGSRVASCTLKATLPKDRWIDVRLQKDGTVATLYVDGAEVASGTLDFPLPAMPCYLGGDPKAKEKEFARGALRSADASAP